MPRGRSFPPRTSGNPGATFKPGQSGNPGGKPSIAKALAANGTTTPEVVAKLAKIALDALDAGPGEVTKVGREYAHTWLTERILGRPPQHVDLDVHLGMLAQQAIAMSPDERAQLIRRKEAELAAFALPAPAEPDHPTEH